MPSKKKQIAEKGTLVITEGEGGKKIPFFRSSKIVHILMGGGIKIFLSHAGFVKKPDNCRKVLFGG